MAETAYPDSEPDDDLDVAIVGMAGRFPGAPSVDRFWQNLLAGVCSARILIEEELAAHGVDAATIANPDFVPVSYSLEDADGFDAAFFGYSPREAELMDPQHRVLLECAWSALESAGIDPRRNSGLVGVYVGAGYNTYLLENVGTQPEAAEFITDKQVVIGNRSDFLGARVSYKLGLEGPSVNIQSACSTSLVAVVEACQALLAFQCDTALAGGVSVDGGRARGYLYRPDGILSPDGLTRTFDARASGTTGGDGVGLVVLKRLRDAESDGDHIHAVIRGTAVNNDGARGAGFTAPAAGAQAAVIGAALAAADVEPGSIGYVELHGTATPLGDPIEFVALRSAFAGVDRGGCVLGSVKTNVGHLDSAAGVAGLIKAVLAVEHDVIPASLHFTEPNPRIPLDDSPFAIATRTRPWPQKDGPRRAGVSSFGLGGTNAHVVLEQAPPRPVNDGPKREELLVLSAASAAALDAATENLHEHLRTHPDTSLVDVAATLQHGRRQLPHRRAMVATDRDDAIAALASPDDGRLLTSDTEGTSDRPVAFLYTGFGAQFPGVARALYDDEPVFRAAVDACTEIVEPLLGQDIRPVVLTPDDRAPSDFRALLADRAGDGGPLDAPIVGYPATFTLGYALTRLWATRGVVPDALIGHSLGETIAACVAGVFTLPDALRLVVERARLVEASDEGAMVAVTLPENDALRYSDDEVSLAAVNGATTCVLSGTPRGIDRVRERLAADNVPHRALSSRYAFHSPLVDPVVAPFEALVAEVPLKPPTIRFVSNVTGTWITDEQATDPAYWAGHLRHPVRFTDGLATLWSVPKVVLVEVGAAPVLTPDALRHPAAATTDRVVVPSLPGRVPGRTDRASMLHAAARLWLAGVSAPFATDPAGRRTPLPTYPFERTRYWLAPVARESGTASARERSATNEWLYSPSWTRLPDAPPADPDRLAAARWLVFADDDGPGHDVADRLRAMGAEVRTVVPVDAARAGDHVLDPTDEDAAVDLAEALRAEGGLPERMVHCWAAGRVPDEDPVEIDGGLDRSFGGLLRWARATTAELMTSARRWDVVTTGTCAVLGDEPLSPLRASVRGLIRVLAQEYPSLTCVHHDTVPSIGAARLVDAFDLDDNTRAVALRGVHRWAPTFTPDPPPAAVETAVVPDGVYLITGGLGRIGLVIARALAERERVRLVLISRSGVPANADAARAVRELEDSGSEVILSATDVTDATAVRRLKDTVLDRFGAIDGVFHCAGTTGRDAHRTVDSIEPQDVARHFDPKVRGAYALRAALADQRLRIAVLCSSVAGLLGGLGFGAYAAANATLDAFAHRHHRPGQPWASVDWEAWLFTAEERAADGVGAAVRDLALTPAEGRTVVDRLLSSAPRPQVAVSTGDLALRERLWSAPVTHQPAPTRHERPALRNPYVAPDGELERRVAEIWQDVLGVSEVGVHDNFFELGGSSLLGLQVVHRLRSGLASAIPLTVVYEGPTVRTLAALVEREGGGR